MNPPGEAFRAAAACFRAWLANRGATGPLELYRGEAQVRVFVQANAEARFALWGETKAGATPVRDRVGFRLPADELYKDQRGWKFYVYPQAFQQELCKGFDSRALAKHLVSRGLLEPCPELVAALDLAREVFELEAGAEDEATA